MDYSLLKNKIYLMLLAYYNKKEFSSFVELGKLAGVSRQTASTKFKELQEKGIIELNDKDILFVKNILNIDIVKLQEYFDTTDSFNAVDLKQYLFNENIENKTQIAKELKMARSSMYLDNHSVVYAIQSEGKIKYIGTTQHFEDRIQQHIKKRPWLTPSNFLILVDNSNTQGFNIELELIHLLQPEWNIVGK